MVCRQERFCRRAKVWVENRPYLVHNADATEKIQKGQKTTAYVNKCNFSTPNIGSREKQNAIYCETVYIIIE
jgi:hypothetical protein